MKATGILSKMMVEAQSPVKYELLLSGVRFDLTSQVGSTLSIEFTGKIFCTSCGKATKKSYGQGYCYPCTMRLAECDLCILRPETCHYDKGTCREPEWGLEHCMRPHIVYLANSSGLKVGITRERQVPTRWLDQGASEALAVLRVKSRLLSGQIEVLFKKHISDKTDWRKMLKGEPAALDLKAERDRLLAELAPELGGLEYEVLDEAIQTFRYPVHTYPEKVSSFNLDKVATIRGRLTGIKGQYLIFDSGVFNVRSHTGYEVMIEGESSGTEDHLSQGLSAVGLPD
jgi:hypothetical protein